MKTLFAFGICIVSAASLAAQSHALSHPLGMLPPVPAVGALGGNYTSPVISRPLGGVALPRFGQPVAPGKKNARNAVGGYVGPIYYVPNAYDTTYSDFSTGYAPQAPTPPVVINQYFVTKGSSVPGEMMPSEPPAPEAYAPAAAPASPGDLLAPAQSYYLIAYKDHSIYSALTYWIEGDTLHYVTTQNTHNQASLGLIDIDKTYKLNTDRSVPFSIPGK